MDLMDSTRAIWGLSDEQEAIVELCEEFATEHIRPAARDVDEADSGSPLELFASASEIGITDFMIPEEFGGGGFTDLFTQCLVQERLCWGDLGIGNLMCSNGFFADPLLVLGSDEQKESWLRPLTGPNPPLTALATTEPNAGSDAASITTTAQRTANGYEITGQKAWISNAGLAKQYVVFAKTDPSERSRGVSAFLLSDDQPGLSFGEPM
jgi:alkylation response protein AidB-like acyl-CoA dehydrogenase